MSYRQSPAFRAAVIAANAQRRNLRFRVGTLANVKGSPLVIRSRRVEVRS